nr:Rep family protein [Helicobacter pylori]
MFEKLAAPNTNKNLVKDITMPNSTKKSAKKDLERTRSYAIIIYPDSANSKWLEILERTCIPCAISPLHDKDLENDGTPKKPHYHVLSNKNRLSKFLKSASF